MDEKGLATIFWLLNIPIGIFSPIIYYLVIRYVENRELSEFEKEHINGMINLFLILLILSIVSFVLVFVFIGIFTMLLVPVLNVLISLYGAYKAYKGEKDLPFVFIRLI
jgi:uncharacterized membrane protein